MKPSQGPPPSWSGDLKASTVANVQADLATAAAHRMPDEDSCAAEAEALVEQIQAAAQGARGEAEPKLRAAIDNLGLTAQRRAAEHNRRLQAAIQSLALNADDGGPVAASLAALYQTVVELDPRRQTLRNGPLVRALSRLPGVAEPLERYFRQFERAQGTLDRIIKELQTGRDRLRRDNVTLGDDRAALWEVHSALQQPITVAQLAEHRLQQRIELLPMDDRGRQLIEQTGLYALRERLVALQQQRTVTEQAALSLETVIDTNEELIRGVDRALEVTLTALRTAITASRALTRRRIALDRIDVLDRSVPETVSGPTTSQPRGRSDDPRSAIGQLASALDAAAAAISEATASRQRAGPPVDTEVRHLEQGATGTPRDDCPRLGD